MRIYEENAHSDCMEVEENSDQNVNKSETHNDTSKANILNCVAKSDAFFKSQQRGEPDLTFKEKYKIAEELLSTNVELFLQRYHKFINVDDVMYFNDFKYNYEVSFYIDEIKKKSNDKKYKAVVKNRRYEALKKLREEGSYFSDREMRHRSPYLYEEFIGKYLTDDERSKVMRTDRESSSFSSFLLEQIDKNYDEQLLRVQETNEETADIEAGEIMEEDDARSSDESEYNSDEESNNLMTRTIHLPSDQKERLRTEFTNAMYENFLCGKDSDFDYSTVDENDEYDSIQQRTIDEEEKYFDEESSGSIHD